MGYFTIPAAELVGDNGRVVCVELQPRMLKGLERRLARAGLTARVDARQCSAQSLSVGDLAGSMDLALLIHVLHETPAPGAMLGQVHAALRPGGRLLIVEPSGHCSEARFELQRQLAVSLGFGPRQDGPQGGRKHRVLWLQRP
jgi:ubiquinone/menaquinone biosynthesis C-methylase UbiE